MDAVFRILKSNEDRPFPTGSRLSSDMKIITETIK